MKGNIKKTLSVILVLTMLVGSCLSLITNAEQTDIYNEDGEMDLDVVFVLDASSSMLYSDPNRIAIDAFNLFVDLCDESCGVGYSVYTEKLIDSSPIIGLNDEENLKNLKKSISEIEYDPYGSTDIALGLTKAMNIHSENKSSDTTRKKAIILLSDGNTYLNNGPRTVAESNKEMQSTLKSLNSKNIPVYSIGLNYDGTLDKEELEKISDKTNGKSYETNTSDELISIISDIFSDIYKLDGTNCEIKNGNVEINVKDNSVFYVNVIIQSNLSVKDLNPVLTSPDGNNVSLTGNDNVKMTNTGSYTLLKLIYPDSGTWNLHLDNADENNCTVTQLDFYSVYIKQNVTKSAAVGESIKIEASLNDGDSIVNDDDLLKTITMTAIVSSENGNTEIILTRESNGVYSGEFTADAEGNYTVKTIASSEKFEKESSVSKISVKLSSVSDSKTEPSSSDSDSNAESVGITAMVFVIIGIVLIIAIVAFAIFAIVHAIIRSRLEDVKTPSKNIPKQPPKQELPKPKPQPPKPQPPVPEPPAPEYVDIPLIEHSDLESLIKKGPDDAFNTNADDYKADPFLEAIIKKGEDDPFKANADRYKADPSLAANIKPDENEPEKKVRLEKDEPPAKQP